MKNQDSYQDIFERFEAEISKTLHDHKDYYFKYYKEDKNLFDSEKIQYADVIATIAEDKPLAYQFADTYKGADNTLRSELQKPILDAAIESLASSYAVDEAQAYCSQDD